MVVYRSPSQSRLSPASSMKPHLRFSPKVDILSKMRHPNLVTLIGVTMNIGLSFMSICIEDQL
ncbi:hypothetical protein BVRB_1g004580 [Beta vulgaris subsp. vulgaris]|nr:hypothetical protein BVRB_1g004580 [Beta vulgaris subsp. vulgaris]